jgi:AcrR family transcriptional regulator
VADRKQEILDAALRGFAEKGLAGTTVEEVRESSGASVGSIYHHFGDKEGIAAALYVAALRDYQDGLLAALAAGDDAERTVKELVRHHLRWVAEDRDRARFLLGGRPPRAAGEIAELNRRVFRATADWLDEQVAAGQIRAIPFGLFYSVLIGPAQEFCRHWLEGRVDTSLRTAERELAAAAWRSLGAGVAPLA